VKEVFFTDEVKHELTRVQSQALPELAALVRMNGSIQIINRQLAVKIRLAYADLARKVYLLIKERFSLKIEIIVKRNNYFAGHNNIYEIILPPQGLIKGFLTDLGLLDEENNLVFRIKKEFINERESQRAYLRGAFLGGGSVNNPDGEYHLEFRCEHRSFAEDLISLLAQFNLEGHLNYHHNKYVVYFKGFDDIVMVLNIIGAHQALLKMEDKKLFKDLKNTVNRQVNFETANLDKTVGAAMSQLEDIQVIEASRGLRSLSRGLREIALLRKDYPYASLKELGELLNPPLSKSGVNHRLRRLKKIADGLRGEL